MKTKASISLTTVLIIGAILILFGIGITGYTLDLLDGTRAYTNYSVAKINARTCFEEALFILKRNSQFVGTDNISTNDGTCSFNVVNEVGNPQHKVITSVGINNATFVEIKKNVDISVKPFDVTNP